MSGKKSRRMTDTPTRSNAHTAYEQADVDKHRPMMGLTATALRQTV